MLEAIVHSKVRSKLRQLVYDGGRLQGSLHRDLHEDVITSTVFGPLQYMTAECCWSIVRKVLLGGRSEHPAGFDLNGFEPDRHELEFWPSGMAVEARVEPDLVIKFDDNAGKRSLIVLLEVKWGGELDEQQLLKQKLAMVARIKNLPMKKIEIAQVLLARNVNTDEARQQVESTRSHGVTWSQIANWARANSARSHGAKADSAASLWAKQLRKLLDQLGIVAFTGFSLPEHAMSDADRMLALEWTINQWRFDGFVLSCEVDEADLDLLKKWRVKDE